LQLACNALLKLKGSIVYEEPDAAADPNEPPDDFEGQLDLMPSLLGSKLEGLGPQVWLEM